MLPFAYQYFGHYIDDTNVLLAPSRETVVGRHDPSLVEQGTAAKEAALGITHLRKSSSFELEPLKTLP